MPVDDLDARERKGIFALASHSTSRTGDREGPIGSCGNAVRPLLAASAGPAAGPAPCTSPVAAVGVCGVQHSPQFAAVDGRGENVVRTARLVEGESFGDQP